jgi:phosphate uptake regulator
MFKTLFKMLSKESLIAQAVDRADESLERARRLSETVFAALLDGVEPESSPYEIDRQINKDEIEVRRMVIEHLATNPRADIAAGLVLISTIIDVERIGDYAKNVYEQAERLDSPWPDKPGFSEVRGLVDELHRVFDDTISAFDQGAAAPARAAMDRQYELNRRCEQLLDELADSSGFSAREVLVLTLTLRFLKRIGAHLSNLASSVVNPFDRIGFRPGQGEPTDLEE